MSRGTWHLVKQSKQFYVNTYRRVGAVLLVSIAGNLLLGVVLYYVYMNQPEHDFYATNGVTAPVPLTPLSAPNESSIPLLASDPGSENTSRVIPE